MYSMRLTCRTSIAVAAMLAAFAGSAHAQFPAPSPQGTVKQTVGLTDIEIVYSRPSVKDRDIFGKLVPYGKVWRTGANSTTTISFSTDVKVEGKLLPAGKYGLYSIPGDDDWTIIFSSDTQAWGSYQYNEEKDALRVKVKARELDDEIETFTIDINDIRDESATLNLKWDEVHVPVRLTFDIVDKVVENIEAAMKKEGGNKPYMQAAMFYYDHNIDLAKARQWVEAAEKERSDAFWILHLKAKILAKQGEKAEAIATARRSMELAKEAGDSAYVLQNKQLIDQLN